ncbi:MAG: TRAP transporter substrate-binding protein [Gammaproteobacteria bacterium]|nr:TRAP transporter substrate-binding protein [Gammaproteobacteria bacterium]
MKKNSHRIPVTLLLPVLWLFVTTPAIAAEITLRVHHFLGTESTPHKSLIEPWARRVEKDSGGKIKVEIHPAMTLGGRAPELVDQVRNGKVDIIWTAAAYTPGAFPRTEVFSLPLVHRGDPIATNLAIRELLDRELSLDFEGLRPLLIHVHQGHAFHLGDQSVSRLEGFKGLVIRPPGRRIGRWTIEALGASITKKRHPKLPKAIANKALDGALMSFQLAESMGVIEAVKSHTLVKEDGFFGTSIYLFLMNPDRYNSLPVEMRAVIDRNSGNLLAKEMGQVWDETGNSGIKAARAQDNGIDVIKGKEEQRIRQALQTVLNRWAKDVEKNHIDGSSLIHKARQAIARHSDE